jgi:hypothetical protein
LEYRGKSAYAKERLHIQKNVKEVAAFIIAAMNEMIVSCRPIDLPKRRPAMAVPMAIKPKNAKM